MHKAFNQLDVNNDGRLSREEIKTGYKKIMGIEISDQEVNEIMARVDTDNSGYIDYNEYIAATTNK
jgi:calcium-dependent protein kinase